MKKRTLTDKMRKLYKTDPAEFFRRTGALGGRKRNEVVTKKQLVKWGQQGAALRDRKPRPRVILGILVKPRRKAHAKDSVRVHRKQNRKPRSR